MVERIVGLKVVMKVPDELGAVTKLKRVGDAVVAETASGVDVLVPNKPAAPGGTLEFSIVGDPSKW